MRASVVSAPTAVVSTSSTPSRIDRAARDPIARALGDRQALAGDQRFVDVRCGPRPPLPSTGIRSPGRTMTTSPTLTSAVGSSTSVPSRRTRAVSGRSASSARMAAVVCRLARALEPLAEQHQRDDHGRRPRSRGAACPRCRRPRQQQVDAEAVGRRWCRARPAGPCCRCRRAAPSRRPDRSARPARTAPGWRAATAPGRAASSSPMLPGIGHRIVPSLDTEVTPVAQRDKNLTQSAGSLRRYGAGLLLLGFLLHRHIQQERETATNRHTEAELRLEARPEPVGSCHETSDKHAAVVGRRDRRRCSRKSWIRDRHPASLRAGTQCQRRVSHPDRGRPRDPRRSRASDPRRQAADRAKRSCEGLTGQTPARARPRRDRYRERGGAPTRQRSRAGDTRACRAQGRSSHH